LNYHSVFFVRTDLIPIFSQNNINFASNHPLPCGHINYKIILNKRFIQALECLNQLPSNLCFDRLLQVAVEVFAECGFREATVRDICSRANVNVASVNYISAAKRRFMPRR